MQHDTLALSDDTMLAVYCRDRDVACPHCRYNLRDNKSRRCPECGRAIELGLHRPAVSLAAYLVLFGGLFGPAMGTPYRLFVASYWLLEGSLNQFEFMFWISLAVCIASIPLVIWVARSRKAFLNLPTSKQWLLALLPMMWYVLALAQYVYQHISRM